MRVQAGFVGPCNAAAARNAARNRHTPLLRSAPVNHSSFGGLSDSWALSLRAKNRSSNTLYSYLLSAKLLEQFLEADGRPTDICKVPCTGTSVGDI